MALTARRTARHGWRPDLPDHRDQPFSPPDADVRTAHVDLESTLPPAYDQSQLGSCVGNGVAAGVEHAQMVQREGETTPSRLFIYYGARQIEGTVSQDSGAQIRDGMKVVAKLGAPPESLWPYDIAKFAQQPPAAAYAAARQHVAVAYKRVAQTTQALKAALAAGHPVVFGFTVYESFESAEVAQTGVLSMPAHGESVVGGHCVVLVGYDDFTQRFKVRNSWGESWGIRGHFTMPYGYVTSRSLASDFWVLTRES